MRNYTFKEWTKNKTSELISEGINSEPQPGDIVITNPKAFMDSVIGKRGGLKNDGMANLRAFSRFKVNNIDGRKVHGDVSHRTYSGGHSKKFNSYDFLDVSPAFNAQGNKVWLNNAPGRRATAHYINKMYPIWAGKMGMDGYATPEQQLQKQMQQMQMQHLGQTQPDQTQQIDEPQMQQQQPQPQIQQQQPVQPQMQQRPEQPQMQQPRQPQPQYQMQQGRNVVPQTDHGDRSSSSGTTGFGFERPSNVGPGAGSLPVGTGGSSSFAGDSGNTSQPSANVGTDTGDMGAAQAGNAGGMRLAASHDPSIMNHWKNNDDGKKYEYYPE